MRTRLAAWAVLSALVVMCGGETSGDDGGPSDASDEPCELGTSINGACLCPDS